MNEPTPINKNKKRDPLYTSIGQELHDKLRLELRALVETPGDAQPEARVQSAMGVMSVICCNPVETLAALAFWAQAPVAMREELMALVRLRGV